MRLALAGGGSGGHIVPGLHLLRYARARAGTLEVQLSDLLWFQSGRAIEERVMQAAGSELQAERVSLNLEARAGGAPSKLRIATRTPSAVGRARKALRRHRSSVLLALGGYTSLPAVLAARSLGLPVALLEINAVRGQATRALAPLARRVFHAWPASLPARTGTHGRHRLIGPPLAPEFTPSEPGADSARARESIGFSPAAPLLLVLGGSQGASALNRFMRDHLRAFLGHGLQVCHQTGPGRLAEALPPCSGYQPLEFIGAPELALEAASLVLCRGGASTLAEVAGCARPALVVPYPHHRDRHQELNARQLGEGVRIRAEAELGVALREELIALARSQEERERMTASLRRAVPHDACERLYAELCALAGA